MLSQVKVMLLWAVVPALGLTACSGSSTSPTATESSRTATASAAPDVTEASVREICLSAVHKTPLKNIRIERAVAAPLSAVKTWVLKGNPEIEWATWSKNLARLPMDERVGVCVYSKVDGSSFTAPPGVNTPAPSQSLVGVVTRNGDSTLYMMGDTSDMLSATPETFGS